eukprot:XP_020404727.1 uncharacterized protein LOC109944390 [Zea mays]
MSNLSVSSWPNSTRSPPLPRLALGPGRPSLARLSPPPVAAAAAPATPGPRRAQPPTPAPAEVVPTAAADAPSAAAPAAPGRPRPRPRPPPLRYGGDDHFRLTKRMEASTGAVPSDVQIYLRGHRGPDPANPDVLCSQKATDRVAAYGEAMSSQHGPDYDWRTSPIDSQAVYASGGKAHGR